MKGFTATRIRAAVVAAAALAVPAAMLSTNQASAATGGDRTSSAEARRVDRVPTPKLDWFDCSRLAPKAWCATVALPLDYDQPKGAQTEVAVLKIKATDQKHKLGTLFVNPGGPGGSGTYLAAVAPSFLSAKVLARFDIVGFDPRGTNFSDNVKCWARMDGQTAAMAGMDVLFPWTAKEKAAYIRSAQAFGRACSTTGKPLSGSMSTAEVARDMDVLRRAVGDRQLSYLGFSYGTYLGDVYAGLFPDRVRAIAIDGNIDPVGWAGTPATAGTPLTARIRSSEGGARALHEILVRCAKAGKDACSFAGTGDPLANYATIVASLQKSPLVVTDPEFGQLTIRYSDLVGWLLNDLYDPSGYLYVSDDLSYVYTLLTTPAQGSGPAATQRSAAGRALARALAAQRAVPARYTAFRKAARSAFPLGFPYDNSPEAYQAVLCTDGLNPANAADWPKYAAAEAKRGPDFGWAWTWASSPCAARTWTVQDEDAYRGPFTLRTANPVLVVGNYWDPATNYASSVKVAGLLPNSRLLSSDSWGHTAYGTSACVTGAVDSYLLTKALPAKGTLCVGDVQPFVQPQAKAAADGAGTARQLPPVVPIGGTTPRS